MTIDGNDGSGKCAKGTCGRLRWSAASLLLMVDSTRGGVRPSCTLPTHPPLLLPQAVGRTIEVRRSYAPEAKGKASDAKDLRRQFLRTHADSERVRFGLRPFPAVTPPPPPPPPEVVKEVLSRPDVQNTMRKGDGGRTRLKDEATEETKVTSPSDLRQALRGEGGNGNGNGAATAAAAEKPAGSTAVAEKP